MSANPISVAVTLAPATVGAAGGSTTDVKVVTMDVMSGGGEGAGGDGSTTRRRRRGRRRQTQKGGGEVEGGDTGEGQVDVQKIVPAPGTITTAVAPAPTPASAIIQPKPVAMQLGGATKRVGAGSAVVATQPQQQPPKVIIAPPKKKPVKIMLVPKKPGVVGAATAAPVRPPKKFTARRVHVTIDNTSKTQKRRRMTIQRIDALTETQLQEAAVLAKLSRAETVKKVPADLLRQMLKDYHMMRGALI